MRTLMYNTKRYDRQSFTESNGDRHELEFLEARLDPRTAELAAGFAAVCVFVNDDVGSETIEHLAAAGVQAIALR
jgi:D-lactate dehydrogenase